ncbi:uncharacterized protein BP5553_08856 [Venustampulla echinocandica]|uniref:Rhodopsin domain-containing protein n=1 Tax=Venustampulla echinocandica TaxID=2656787 RepID=A0A370TD56_9HELO|nr:uncharacterized protein BP5553_08856 [Venustampulla echinocandica]RDL32400.1 hypothetical protein BP5553_08856 [Venustampulla echinocandica]
MAYQAPTYQPQSDISITKVSQEGFLITTWTLFAVSSILFIVRTIIKLKVLRKLSIDDALFTLGYLLLVGLSVLSTNMVPWWFSHTLMLYGHAARPDNYFLKYMVPKMKVQYGVHMLYWSCLYAIKGSFLAFFHRLTGGLQTPRKILWVLIGFTFLTYLSFIFSLIMVCPSMNFQCGEPGIKRSMISMRYGTSIDIISDTLIMLFPILLVYRLKLPLMQKFGLFTLFSLGIFIMVIAAVRVTALDNSGEWPLMTWLNLWSIMEANVAVIVCALGSFKLLISQASKTPTDQLSPGARTPGYLKMSGKATTGANASSNRQHGLGSRKVDPNDTELGIWDCPAANKSTEKLRAPV